MRKFLRCLIICALGGSFGSISALGSAQAAAPFSEFAIGPLIGTTGIGVQVTTSLWPDYINLTAGYSGFAYHYEATTQGQRYNADMRVGGAPIYLSAYPFGPKFHFDAGIFINSNHIGLTAQQNSSGNYTYAGHSYTRVSLDQVSGETHFSPVAPYLGIGWGNPLFGSRWTFNINAGVILEGGPSIRLSAANESSVPGATRQIKDAEHTFNSRMSFLKTYPVLNIGFSYRF